RLALVGVAFDFAVSFANRPFLKLVGLGGLITGAGLLIGGLYLALRLVGVLPSSAQVVGLAALFLLVGPQVLMLGALGEFTHRIYRLVQGMPLFEVGAVHRIEPGVEAPAEGSETSEARP
ncbi:MAG: hypothetical protein AAFZ65_15700, partial [Planctomycetota bacterium]